MDGPSEIIVWSDLHRRKIVSRSPDTVVRNASYEMQEADVVVERNPCLRQATRPKLICTDDDLMLLPPRLFVYSLRYQFFAPVSVKDLMVIPKQDDPFQHLQLPEDNKRMIQALVQSHLRRRRMEKQIEACGGTVAWTQDLIQDKGRGLIIMLHGEPGVGKTATAEAVARSTGRPLFPISCDLFLEVGMEEHLDFIFRVAHMWDCTLLMDEVDVILTARSASNGLNTLVSSKLFSSYTVSGCEWISNNFTLSIFAQGRILPRHFISHHQPHRQA